MNNAFTKLNTEFQLLYLLTVFIVSVSSVNPVISAASAISAVAAVLVYCDIKYFISVLRFILPLCAAIFLFNILFNRNGVTVLFNIGDFFITKEALAFSFFSSLVFISSALWFSAFSDLIGSDKIYNVFCGISKNLAVIFSLTMSMIPNIIEKGNEIKITQKSHTEAKSKVGYILNISALFSRVLEDSFVTAQTMKARGALLPSKKRAKVNKLTFIDCFFALTSVIIVLFFFILKLYKYSIYPLLEFPGLDATSIVYYLFLVLYLFLPVIIFALEELKWLYMKSKI